MKVSSSIRFIVELVLATLFCLSLLFHVATSLAVCLALALLLWMGGPQVWRPSTPRNERWLILCFIAPLAIFAFITMFFPSFHISHFEDVVTSVLRSPWFVALMWVYLLCQFYRQWRREKGKADAYLAGANSHRDCS